MTQHTAQTAPTLSITAANGIHYAYRHLGPPLTSPSPSPIPLVMHIHFRANMDHWDPTLLNTLAACRPVLIFDQPGVGRTPGSVPTRYQGWADDLIALIDALGLAKIDLLGFSMGGIAVQYVALTRPGLVRRLVLAGTTASAPAGDSEGVVRPREIAPAGPIKALAGAEGLEQGKRGLQVSFFYDNEAGRRGFAEYWARVGERKVVGEEVMLELLRMETSKRQMEAAADITVHNARGTFDRLGELKMPVLVANGDNDVLIPSSRSWELYRHIENAQLVMYPKAGHGFLWQYAEMFGTHVNGFLDAEEYSRAPVAKL